MSLYSRTSKYYSLSTARNGKTSVGTVSTIVLDEEPNRRRASFVNDSDETIYLSKGGALANQGITLKIGGSYEDVPDPSGYIYRGVYCAISASGTKNLSWIEEYTP